MQTERGGDLKKITSILLSVLLIISVFGGCAGGKENDEKLNNKQNIKYSKTFFDLFDTASTITAYDADEETFNKNYQLVYNEVLKYSKYYDIYNSYGDLVNLKYLNENAAENPVKVSSEIIKLLEYGKYAYKITDGYVNICMGAVLSIWHDYREDGINNPDTAKLPPDDELKSAAKHIDINDLIIDSEKSTVYFADSKLLLDVGAIAKGFVCDKIYEYITQNNIWQSAVISLGGNIITVGSKPDGSKFNIGIENPNGSGYIKEISADDKTSVVTSGGYQRYYTVDGAKYCHIINPNTLYPADFMQSVTIISASSAFADAMSTALFCMSIDEGKQFAKQNHVNAVWLDNDNNVTANNEIERTDNEENNEK